MEAILPVATVLGPILLLAALVYAWLRNRKTSRSVDRAAERGARELRRRDVARTARCRARVVSVRRREQRPRDRGGVAVKLFAARHAIVELKHDD